MYVRKGGEADIVITIQSSSTPAVFVINIAYCNTRASEKYVGGIWVVRENKNEDHILGCVWPQSSACLLHSLDCLNPCVSTILSMSIHVVWPCTLWNSPFSRQMTSIELFNVLWYTLWINRSYHVQAQVFIGRLLKPWRFAVSLVELEVVFTLVIDARNTVALVCPMSLALTHSRSAAYCCLSLRTQRTSARLFDFNILVIRGLNIFVTQLVFSAWYACEPG